MSNNTQWENDTIAALSETSSSRNTRRYQGKWMPSAQWVHLMKKHGNGSVSESDDAKFKRSINKKQSGQGSPGDTTINHFTKGIVTNEGRRLTKDFWCMSNSNVAVKDLPTGGECASLLQRAWDEWMEDPNVTSPDRGHPFALASDRSAARGDSATPAGTPASTPARSTRSDRSGDTLDRSGDNDIDDGSDRNVDGGNRNTNARRPHVQTGAAPCRSQAKKWRSDRSTGDSKNDDDDTSSLPSFTTTPTVQAPQRTVPTPVRAVPAAQPVAPTAQRAAPTAQRAAPSPQTRPMTPDALANVTVEIAHPRPTTKEKETQVDDPELPLPQSEEERLATQFLEEAGLTPKDPSKCSLSKLHDSLLKCGRKAGEKEHHKHYEVADMAIGNEPHAMQNCADLKGLTKCGTPAESPTAVANLSMSVVCLADQLPKTAMQLPSKNNRGVGKRIFIVQPTENIVALGQQSSVIKEVHRKSKRKVSQASKNKKASTEAQKKEQMAALLKEDTVKGFKTFQGLQRASHKAKSILLGGRMDNPQQQHFVFAVAEDNTQ